MFHLSFLYFHSLLPLFNYDSSKRWTRNVVPFFLTCTICMNRTIKELNQNGFGHYWNCELVRWMFWVRSNCLVADITRWFPFILAYSKLIIPFLADMTPNGYFICCLYCPITNKDYAEILISLFLDKLHPSLKNSPFNNPRLKTKEYIIWILINNSDTMNQCKVYIYISKFNHDLSTFCTDMLRILSSKIMSSIKFREEVCRSWCLCLMEVPHHVSLLLPDLYSLLKLHLTLTERLRSKLMKRIEN